MAIVLEAGAVDESTENVRQQGSARTAAGVATAAREGEMAVSRARRFAPRCATVVSLIALLLAACTPAHAALSSQACLAKKLKQRSNLRKCQSVESAKQLQSKPFDLAKCQASFDKQIVKIDAQAAKAAVGCRFALNGDGTLTDLDTGLQWEQKTDDGTVHDKDNGYAWSTVANGPANGTVFRFTTAVFVVRFSDGVVGGCGCLALFCGTADKLAARAVRNGL